MIFRLCAVVLFFCPIVAQAQQLRVQTGDHPTFTRVVVSLPAGSDWQIGRSSTGYALRVPQIDGYDTSRFFDLIQRDRIVDVTQDPAKGDLQLWVDCECRVEAVLEPSNILIIDVFDGSPTAESPFEVALDTAPVEPVVTPPTPPSPRRQALLPVITSRDAAQGLPVLGGSTATTSPDPVEPATEVVEDNDTDAAEPAAATDIANDLAALEQSISESLARALSQGLLETELGPDGGTPATAGPIATPEQPAPGIRAATSVDRNAIPENPQVSVTQSGQTCQPDSYFDVAAWGDDRPFFDQVSTARAAVTTEFDRVDEAAVQRLAQIFLYFGFGREASQVLDLDQVNSVERQYLHAMAAIIDDDPVDVSMFATQSSCPSNVALWAVLAHEKGTLDAKTDRAAVLRTFKALPSALKTHLAPKLSDRMVAIGDFDAAEQALAPVRAVPDQPLTVDVAELSLRRALGEEAEAAARLAEIVQTDQRATPALLIEMLENAMQAGTPIDARDLSLADVMRFENARDPVAIELADTQVRAHLSRLDFPAAKRLMTEYAEAFAPDQLALLSDAYAADAADHMADADFLQFAFQTQPALAQPSTDNAMARRLLDLGFADAAGPFVAGDAPADLAEDRDFLRAEIALQRRDVPAVMATLTQYPDDRAVALRNIASDIAASDAIMPQPEAAELTDATLWRQGAWDRLIEAEDPLLQAASTAAVQPNLGPADLGRPLAAGRALLEQSAQSRDILNDLLTRFEGPTEF